MLSYKEKYLKYKEKYINFKNTGGTLVEVENCMRDDYYIDDIIFTVSRNKINLERQLKIIKSKKIFTFTDFMNIEQIFNNLDNIKSYIEYYKRVLLQKKIKGLQKGKEMHNKLHELLLSSEHDKEKLNEFMKENVLNNICKIKNLIYDQQILDKLKILKRELEELEKQKQITPQQLQQQQLRQQLLKDKVRSPEELLLEEFFRKQNIVILGRYINLIEQNILNVDLLTIENDAFSYNDSLWQQILKSKNNEEKVEKYKNILLKLFEISKKLKYKNILSYHQQKQKLEQLEYDVLNKKLLTFLQDMRDNHLLLKYQVDPKNQITDLETFKAAHKTFIETKYGEKSKLIQDNINVSNFIESLRWIVYKYYNLLMIKSTSCKTYKESIFVYEFFNRTTGLLVSVVYFDLNYKMGFSRGYITEFRTKYSYKNTFQENIVVVPIIYLYVDFTDPNPSLSEIKSKLFHEFGHAIHTILSQNNYQILSPNVMRADYVEIMSLFFELYILEEELFSRFLVKELIEVKENPEEYDKLPKSKLYQGFDFENYFNENENIFLSRINFLLMCLLEIRLKVLPLEELQSLNIIDYSERYLQELKTTHGLPNYVSYIFNIFKFERIYKYPIYYVYYDAQIIVKQIRSAFKGTLFNPDKINMYINDIINKADIYDIVEEIKKFIPKLLTIA
jgi:Zn-dependent oligopeptidase